MGSTRLPGKMMLPLACDHLISHVVQRAAKSVRINDVVVATSMERADDVLARQAERTGASVFRGSEYDVLGRMFQAAKLHDVDTIVRISGDCPLISPPVIDAVIERLVDRDADYATNIIGRTFPRGLDVEAFTFESFECVEAETTEDHDREHVTPYYQSRDDLFTHASVASEQVFDEPWMQERNDIRLTLDEADDYELLRKIYENLDYDETPDIRDVVRFIDEGDLQDVNSAIYQKVPDDFD
jgi:spore coat polysaccharide biosynthesis protein SpsF